MGPLHSSRAIGSAQLLRWGWAGGGSLGPTVPVIEWVGVSDSGIQY